MCRPALIAVSLVLSIQAPAWAGDTGDADETGAHWYLSGATEAGTFWKQLESFNLPDDPEFLPLDTDFLKPGLKGRGLGLEGGYRISRFIAVELGYRDYSQTDLLDFGCDGSGGPRNLGCPGSDLGPDTFLSSYSLSIVPRWPVNDSLSLYGKLGVVDWIIESDDFSELDYNNLQYGLGVRYDFTNEFGILIEYEAVDTERNATSVGLNWRF